MMEDRRFTCKDILSGGVHLDKAQHPPRQPRALIKEWFYHWDTSPVPNATIIQKWMAVYKIQLLQHSPYFPDLAPADYFLFQKELAGCGLTPRASKRSWRGSFRNIGIYKFAITPRQ
jgi:hypothetical protein